VIEATKTAADSIEDAGSDEAAQTAAMRPPFLLSVRELTAVG
jgi:hypothetical protein